MIAAGLRAVIAEHLPEEAVIEEVFLAKNSQSALKLAQVRGVALVVAREAPLEVPEVSPREVKMAWVGDGNAEKAQVQLMVRALLGLEATPAEDAADALAGAICRATMKRL